MIVGSTWFSNNHQQDLAFKMYVLDTIYNNLGYDVVKKDRIGNLSDIESAKNHYSMDINGNRYALTEVQDGDHDLSPENWVVTRQTKMADGSTQYRLVSPNEHGLFVATAQARLAAAEASKDKDGIQDWNKLLGKLEHRDSMTPNQEYYRDVRAESLDSKYSFRAPGGQQFAFNWNGSTGGFVRGPSQASSSSRGQANRPSQNPPSSNVPSQDEAINTIAQLITAHQQKFPQQMTDQARLDAVNQWAKDIAAGKETSGDPILDAKVKQVLQVQASGPSANAPGGSISSSAPAVWKDDYLLTAIPGTDPVTGKKMYILTRFKVDANGIQDPNSKVRSKVSEDDVTTDANERLVLKNPDASGSPTTSAPAVATPGAPAGSKAPAVNPVASVKELFTKATLTSYDSKNQVTKVETVGIDGEVTRADLEALVKTKGAQLKKDNRTPTN